MTKKISTAVLVTAAMAALSTAAAVAISTEDIASLSTSDTTFVGFSQVDALSSQQIEPLTTGQIESLTSESIPAASSPEELESHPDEIDPADPRDQFGTMPDGGAITNAVIDAMLDYSGKDKEDEHNRASATSTLIAEGKPHDLYHADGSVNVAKIDTSASNSLGTLPDGTEITSQLVDDVAVHLGADPEDYSQRTAIRYTLMERGLPPGLYDEDGNVTIAKAFTTASADVVASSEGTAALVIHNTDHPARQFLTEIENEVNQYGGALATRVIASLNKVRSML